MGTGWQKSALSRLGRHICRDYPHATNDLWLDFRRARKLDREPENEERTLSTEWEPTNENA